MATQAVRQYREPIAIGLLGIAIVYLCCGLALLFKSYDNVPYTFAVRSALDGHVFTSPVIIGGLTLAVFLVAEWGEPSAHARTIVLATIAIGAVAMIFAVVAWLASFGADEIVPFAGVAGAGKISGAFLSLAQIGLLALALFYGGVSLQALPRPVRATPQWGPQYQQPGWPPNQEWQQGAQWQGSQYQAPPPPWAAPPGQPSWGPAQGTQSQPPGWGEPSATQAQYGWQQYAPEWPQQAAEAAPPGYEPGAEPSSWRAPTEQPYWRTPDEPAAPAEQSQSETEPTGWEPAAGYETPSHAAAPAAVEESEESGSGAEPDEPPTTMSTWASGAPASASDVAGQDASADADDEGEAEAEDRRSDDTHDDSGWWRPSAQ